MLLYLSVCMIAFHFVRNLFQKQIEGPFQKMPIFCRCCESISLAPSIRLALDAGKHSF